MCLVLTFFSEDSVMSCREGLVARVLSFCVNPFFCEDSVMFCRKNVRNVACVLFAASVLASGSSAWATLMETDSSSTTDNYNSVISA